MISTESYAKATENLSYIDVFWLMKSLYKLDKEWFQEFVRGEWKYIDLKEIHNHLDIIYLENRLTGQSREISVEKEHEISIKINDEKMKYKTINYIFFYKILKAIVTKLSHFEFKQKIIDGSIVISWEENIKEALITFTDVSERAKLGFIRQKHVIFYDRIQDSVTYLDNFLEEEPYQLLLGKEES